MHTDLADFSSFLEKTLSPHHTAAYVCQALERAGFKYLDEKVDWQLEEGSKYYTTKGCTTTAFITPMRTLERAHCLACHLDTPALKLRPAPLFFEEDLAFLRTEIYGGPHLYSLMNRKLQLAGAIWHDFSSKLDAPSLVHAKEQHFFMPTCPIHLDKTTNTSPLPIDKHSGLAVLVGDKEPRLNEEEQLARFFKQSFQTTRMPIAFDLYLTVCETPYTIDSEKTKLAAPRLDNSVSVFAQLQAVSHVAISDDCLIVAPFFHHEEVGSSSDQGADSGYLNGLLMRISSHFGMNVDQLSAFKNRSSILSLDNAHAFWPLDGDKYDKPNTPILGKGPALKLTSSMKYATSPELFAQIKHLAAKRGIPLQLSVPHSKFPAGSTLGPLLARSTNIPTLDLGIGQCSMHAASELIDVRDLSQLIYLVKSYLTLNT